MDPSGDVVGFLGVMLMMLLLVVLQKIQSSREKYPFGPWQNAMEATVIFAGCELAQDCEFRISLGQERFALTVDEINIPQERQRRTEEEVTALEKKGTPKDSGSSQLESDSGRAMAFVDGLSSTGVRGVCESSGPFGQQTCETPKALL